MKVRVAAGKLYCFYCKAEFPDFNELDTHMEEAHYERMRKENSDGEAGEEGSAGTGSDSS